MMKKLLASVLIFVVLFMSLAPFSAAKAQTTWYSQSPTEWYLKVYDNSNPSDIFGERYTAAQVQWITYSIPSIFINWITNGNPDMGACLMGVLGAKVDVNVCAKGIKDSTSSLQKSLGLSENVREAPSIASQIFAERPISGISYVKNVVGKLSPVTTVHAQQTGFGFDILSPVLFLWTASRNIAFFFLVIVSVVFAFMVMFRVKLSPQVVISVQSALPKIIVALVLATFSYAIAGLMIDLIYVLMGVFSTLIVTSTRSSFGGFPVFAQLKAQGVFAFINGTMPVFHDSGISLIIYFVLYILLFLVAVIIALIASVSGIQLSSILFSLLLLIFTIILLLILIWYVFKTIYVLFKTLATVYGLIIIAPIQITAGALFPQMGFGSWAKKLFSKLLVFPLTGIFILFSFTFLLLSMSFSLQGLATGNIVFNIFRDLLSFVNMATGIFGATLPANIVLPGMWGPPMLGNPAAATGIAFILMSIGMIMMIPKISDSIDSFLAGKGFAGTAIGEAMGPFGGLGKAAGGAAMGAAQGAGAGYLGNKMGGVVLTPQQQKQWYGKLFEAFKDSLNKMGGKP